MEIHERLKFLREQNKKTVREVSEVIGSSVSTYLAYERGGRKIRLKILIKLANFYDVSVDYLCGRDMDHNFIYIPLHLRPTTKKVLKFNNKQLEKFTSYVNELFKEDEG